MALLTCSTVLFLAPLMGMLTAIKVVLNFGHSMYHIA